MSDVNRKPPGRRCICGKKGYLSRQLAKLVIREMKRLGDDANPGHQARAYRCDENPQLWHVGHANPAVNWPDLNDPRLRFLPGEL